jgi:hypothetical protein
VVGLQARVQCLLVVVAALHQGLAGDLGDGEQRRYRVRDVVAGWT